MHRFVFVRPGSPRQHGISAGIPIQKLFVAQHFKRPSARYFFDALARRIRQYISLSAVMAKHRRFPGKMDGLRVVGLRGPERTVAHRDDLLEIKLRSPASEAVDQRPLALSVLPRKIPLPQRPERGIKGRYAPISALVYPAFQSRTVCSDPLPLENIQPGKTQGRQYVSAGIEQAGPASLPGDDSVACCYRKQGVSADFADAAIGPIHYMAVARCQNRIAARAETIPARYQQAAVAVNETVAAFLRDGSEVFVQGLNAFKMSGPLQPEREPIRFVTFVLGI